MNPNSEFSMQDAMRLAQSPAGQQLLAMLQRQNGEALQNAMRSAASGDYNSAKSLLASLLTDPQAQELLRQLGG